MLDVKSFLPLLSEQTMVITNMRIAYDLIKNETSIMKEVVTHGSNVHV